MELTSFPIKITQIPARKVFFYHRSRPFHFYYSVVTISICASRIYRGHLLQLGSTKHVRSSQVSHGGVGQLGKFVARRGTTFFSASGVTQGTGQVFVMESLTPASDGSSGNVVEKEKVTTGSEEAV
jgi:hypothetical protein